jgi:hypothetical protein
MSAFTKAFNITHVSMQAPEQKGLGKPGRGVQQSSLPAAVPAPLAISNSI